MKTLLLIAIAGLALSDAGLAQSADKARGFDAFRLVRTRNIFDPSRQPQRTDSAPRAASPSRGRPNYLALTGTMVTPGKSLAFFSGGGSAAGKVAAVGETIADFKVASITPGQVELSKGGTSTALAVGKQLTLGGSIAMPAGGESAATSEEAAATSTDPAPASAAPAARSSTSSNDDVLRRLMERRQKETTK